MLTTKITLDVPAEMYNILLSGQEKLKEKQGKKQSLATILLNLSKIGLKSSKFFAKVSENIETSLEKNDEELDSAQNFDVNEQNNPSNEQYFNQFEQINTQKTIKTHKNLYIFEQKDELEAMFLAVQSKERDLKQKIFEFENQKMEYFAKYEKLLHEKELLLKKITNEEVLKKELEVADKNAKNLNAIISGLKQQLMNRKLKISNLTKELKTAIRRSKRVNTKQNYNLMEQLLPFIPALVALGYIWYTNRDKLKPDEMKKQMEEVLKSQPQ